MTSSVVGPSGPRPGVERLAEVLRDSGMAPRCLNITTANCDAMMESDWCGHCRMCVALAQTVDLLVAAIPSLPVEALAELVGGEVERAVQGFPSSGMSEVPTMPLLTEPTHSRVVTPWRSVTSPKENR